MGWTVGTLDSSWFISRQFHLKLRPPSRPKESYVRLRSTQEGGVLDGKPIGIQPGAEKQLLTFAAPACCSAVQRGGWGRFYSVPVFQQPEPNWRWSHKFIQHLYYCRWKSVEEVVWSQCERTCWRIIFWVHWSFNDWGCCISQISHCCIVFSSKQSTSLGCREKLSVAAAAAAAMSHYQLVNSLSDSLTAPFIFFPLSCSFMPLTTWPSLVSSYSTRYALQVMSHLRDCSCQKSTFYLQPASEIKNNGFSRKWENLAGFQWEVINTGLNTETFLILCQSAPCAHLWALRHQSMTCLHLSVLLPIIFLSSRF